MKANKKKEKRMVKGNHLTQKIIKDLEVNLEMEKKIKGQNYIKK